MFLKSLGILGFFYFIRHVIILFEKRWVLSQILERDGNVVVLKL
ncbi:hypothetical protein CLOSPI_00533 [Thomasclavelia spiroformis DSM 1552]|jgi:hypothetical protein|uniref:Uncharacterized protein n=1 Tax=Thomasclavelia spiroformis DSM 1552 TaxID=428126 RepID=B1C006_9FIRM|nr:hypothetical protein CLOSPI_00533 [Thomasclavelia spiroformis DSM 1552]